MRKKMSLARSTEQKYSFKQFHEIKETEEPLVTLSNTAPVYQTETSIGLTIPRRMIKKVDICFILR